MKRLFFGVAVMFVLCGFSVLKADAQPIVVPNANESVEGDSNNGFPFNADVPIRYQQVYSSSQIPACGRITQISFRNNNGENGDSITYPNILIQLSTTSVTPETLSTTFADNIGSNVTTVYSGELSFSTPDCNSGPCPFNNTIVLQAPFVYSPGSGNLLLDVTVPTAESYIQFDSVRESPFIQRVFNDLNVNAETGFIGGDNGLVTEIVCERVTTPIPTMSEWGLIAMAGVLGIVGLIALRRRVVL